MGRPHLAPALRCLHGAVDAVFGAAALIIAEWAVATWFARAEFVGPWELRAGFVRLLPLAGLPVLAAALFGSLVLGLAAMRTGAARAALTALAAFGAGAVAVGVTHGRHFAALPVRAAFVGAIAALGGALAWRGAPWGNRVLQRAAGRTALAAIGCAMVLELANRAIFPRLYPAFHDGLSVLTCMLAPAWGRLLPPGDPRAGPTRGRWRLLALGAPLWVLTQAPALARALTLADNLRLVFLGRAPLMSLGVQLAAVLAPPPPLDHAPPVDAPTADDRLKLDWRERDVLLISVDALRADHVGAYGYTRPTTPHLDALAREGTLFAHAYCPTPHTSYSVTSMMTGKNMRPLLLQGLGSDSDTAAGLLRTYGYRTAAFYPPAVFFIDEDLFTRYRDRRLDFEYARIEFATPSERVTALRQYLTSQRNEQKLFVWVHLFEPHEPYVAHAEHEFGDRDVDRYDSEVATADDGIGEIVRVMRERRPGAVVIVTADHGEEFGEHQGRYHGTTVYEEQVRVPLVIAAPEVAPGRRVEAPVQTIDVLPTLLAALDIPRPPRVRGNELSRFLRANSAVAPAGARDGGAEPVGATPLSPAFAETEEQTLLADAEWRLVCARRIGACALYNLDLDPQERHDVSAGQPERLAAMKSTLARLQASHGTYESAVGQRPWPDAIRRGLAGDADAVPDVAALLDDSDVAFRRKAAEVLFDLRGKVAAPELKLALSRDDDELVRRWCALALTRVGDASPRAVELLDSGELGFRRLAALALAENGDARGAAVLVAWWQEGPPPFARARELLTALAEVRAKEAVPSLISALHDVRLRPHIAQTLAAIGQPSARPPLAQSWATERYQTARVAIGEALLQLGAKSELVAPLVRFLGTPDPLPNGLSLALRAGVLGRVGGPSEAQLAAILGARAGDAVALHLKVPPGGNATGRRLLVRARATGAEGAVLSARVQPNDAQATRAASAQIGEAGREASPVVTVEFSDRQPTERAVTLPSDFGGQPSDVAGPDDLTLVLSMPAGLAVEALAVVPLADELPPPPPMPWTPPDSEAAHDDGTPRNAAH